MPRRSGSLPRWGEHDGGDPAGLRGDGLDVRPAVAKRCEEGLHVAGPMVVGCHAATLQAYGSKPSRTGRQGGRPTLPPGGFEEVGELVADRAAGDPVVQHTA